MVLQIIDGKSHQDLGINHVRESFKYFSDNGLKIVLMFLEVFLKKDTTLLQDLPPSSLLSRKFIQGMTVGLISKLFFKGFAPALVLQHMIGLFCVSMIPQRHGIYQVQGEQSLLLLALGTVKPTTTVYVMAELLFRRQSGRPASMQAQALSMLIQELTSYPNPETFRIAAKLTQQVQHIMLRDRKFTAKFSELLKIYDNLIAYFAAVPFDPSMLEEMKTLFFPDMKALFPSRLHSQVGSRYHQLLECVKEDPHRTELQKVLNGLRVLPSVSGASSSSASSSSSSSSSRRRVKGKRGRRRRKK